MTNGDDSNSQRDLGDIGRGYMAEGDPERPAGKGERLAMAIRAQYRSTADFAREAGISEGLVRQHIHRSTIPSKYLPTYTRFLKRSADWLLEGRGPAVVEPFAGTGTTSFAGGGATGLTSARVDKEIDLIIGSPPFVKPIEYKNLRGLKQQNYKQYLQSLLAHLMSTGAKHIAITAPEGVDRDEIRKALPGVTVAFIDPPSMPLRADPAREKTDTPEPHAIEALVGDRDLPVYGVAQGGAGAMQVDPSPIEYVKRPAPLMGVTGAFAVYVVGDSMSPAYEQGDLILVHPGKPIERGLDALLCDAPEHGEWHAIVKRVDNWTEKVWRLTQFNPKKSYEVPRSEFPRAFRIVGKYNRR